MPAVYVPHPFHAVHRSQAGAGLCADESANHESGYSFESMREICEQAQGDVEINEDGNFLKESLDKLFGLVYTGFPTKAKAQAESESSSVASAQLNIV